MSVGERLTTAADKALELLTALQPQMWLSEPRNRVATD